MKKRERPKTLPRCSDQLRPGETETSIRVYYNSMDVIRKPAENIKSGVNSHFLLEAFATVEHSPVAVASAPSFKFRGLLPLQLSRLIWPLICLSRLSPPPGRYASHGKLCRDLRCCVRLCRASSCHCPTPLQIFYLCRETIVLIVVLAKWVRPVCGRRCSGCQRRLGCKGAGGSDQSAASRIGGW